MKSKKISREQKISDSFFIWGAQYFAVARYSAHIFLMPITGNLYHHAIEMFLKGFLATDIPPVQLAKKSIFGHDLIKLWEEFKTRSAESNLRRFDRIIHEINNFEDIRYPDRYVDNGAWISISIGTHAPSIVHTTKEPEYKIRVDELDELVNVIFTSASIPPHAYFGKMDAELKRWIPKSFL